MQNARRHQPSGARLQPVRLREIQNVVIAAVPAREASTYIRFGRSRLKSEVSVRKVARGGVQLRRKVVALGLALAPHEFRLRLALMEMVGNRAEIVEELAVDQIGRAHV